MKQIEVLTKNCFFFAKKKFFAVLWVHQNLTKLKIYLIESNKFHEKNVPSIFPDMKKLLKYHLQLVL